MTTVMSFSSMCLYAVNVNGHWRPGIGDPTFMGWFITVSYFVAAFFCFRNVKECRRQRAAPMFIIKRSVLYKMQTKAIVFWISVTAAMCLLGINKQLDLHTLLTMTGRDIAKAWGWYEGRRAVQSLFIKGVAGVGVLVLLSLFALIRGMHRRYRFALIGLIFIACFIMVRAVSMHHVDSYISQRIAGMKMNWFFELTGIFIVAAAARLRETKP
jgi:hypothetical protein